MRILNVSAQKPDSTGSGVYLAQTLRCELAAGHEAAVICGIDAADEPALPAGTRAYPVRFNTPELPFPVAGMSDQMPYEATRYRDMTPQMCAAFKRAFRARIDQALDEFRPDAIVCHHLYLVTSLVRERVDARGGGVPVHAICHSTELRQMRSHDLERDFITKQVRRLDGIFALHEAQRQEIARVYGCDPGLVRVLGTGYDDRVFRREGPAACAAAAPAAPAAPAPGAAPLNILYVGKIWSKKGVGCLLEALDELAPGEGGAVLRLAGGHNDEAEYARYRQRAQDCRCPVEFLGQLPPARLAERYRQADVFVLPSFFEGLPLVVVEALACGCRVVVSDLPGIRPWLEESAPGAPVVYLQPPRMRGADEPYPEDLPAFSGRIARGIEQAAALPPCEADLHELSWEGLTARLVSML